MQNIKIIGIVDSLRLSNILSTINLTELSEIIITNQLKSKLVDIVEV